MTFWKQGSLELGPFANPDVKSKTTAGFTNSWLHPPNQLGNPRRETWCRFSIKSRNSYSVVSGSDTSPETRKSLRIFFAEPSYRELS